MAEAEDQSAGDSPIILSLFINALNEVRHKKVNLQEADRNLFITSLHVQAKAQGMRPFGISEGLTKGHFISPGMDQTDQLVTKYVPQALKFSDSVAPRGLRTKI